MIDLILFILGVGPLAVLFCASMVIFVGALLSDAKLINIDIAYNKRPYKQILKALGISIIVFFIYCLYISSLISIEMN